MSGSIQSSYQLSNFPISLLCPVSFNPLSDAVILVPCGHTISKVAADHIYHGMRETNGNEMVVDQKPCPLCTRNVQAYHPNLLVRLIVESSLRAKAASPKAKEESPLVLALRRQEELELCNSW